jgi:hypothetical protein
MSGLGLESPPESTAKKAETGDRGARYTNHFSKVRQMKGDDNDDT